MAVNAVDVMVLYKIFMKLDNFAHYRSYTLVHMRDMHIN